MVTSAAYPEGMRRQDPLAILLLAAALALVLPQGVAAEGERLPGSVTACPGQDDPGAPVAVQVRAMRCLTNLARSGRGLSVFSVAPVLSRAAAHKSADILRCDEFSHEACDRPFTYWMERFGYLSNCGGAGENIAWGNGELGSPRKIFSAWMHSAGHRENILGAFEQIGIGLRVGSLEGVAGAHVWTQDFGSHDC
jgi:uncharacterized protein YkwD